jgi:hypothetical protein
MTGHQEHWGVTPRDETVTVLLCNRCAKPYGVPGGPLHMHAGDSLTIMFPCCPDLGGQHIEWEQPIEVDA